MTIERYDIVNTCGGHCWLADQTADGEFVYATDHEAAVAALAADRGELLTFLKRLAASGDWYIGALEFNTLLHDGEDLEREMLALIAKAEGGVA